MPSLSPGTTIPETSPLTSAINTAVPILENASAITLIVTVLPVPVAPAIRPCLEAIFGYRYKGFSPAVAIHARFSFLRYIAFSLNQ